MGPAGSLFGKALISNTGYYGSVPGCIIQVPSLEKGDRLVVEEPATHLPVVLPVTYADGYDEPVFSAKTVRYVNLDRLPEALRVQCERHILSDTDA